MEMSTESRIFFKLVELFGLHKAPDYRISSYWNDDRQLVIIIPGNTAEAVINFECGTNFDIELREEEFAGIAEQITVPFDATDDDLKEIVERVVEYILNTTVA